ncbi:MAG: hypothetical protein ABIS47_11475 [Acidimicrobiales bacterium]
MAGGESSEQESGPVELTVPARSEHLRVLRLVTVSVAASLELDIDQLDDLRIAIDDLCSLLIEDAGPEARLHLVLTGRVGRLVATASIKGAGGGAGAPMDPISRLILDGLDVEWTKEEQSASFRLVAPRPPEPSAQREGGESKPGPG